MRHLMIQFYNIFVYTILYVSTDPDHQFIIIQIIFVSSHVKENIFVIPILKFDFKYAKLFY